MKTIPAQAIGHGGRAAGVLVDTNVQRTVLPNGLTVLSEYVPGVRSVAFGAWVRAATLHETRGEMGVSHLLEHMVFKGTERRSARAISLALETLGGSLDAYTSREYTSYQARVLDNDLAEAADVIADLIFRPALRDSDLRLERNVILEEIAMVDDTPDDLVFELHNEKLWGDNGYGFRILGTPETVSQLGVKELRRLHTGAYRPDNVVVAVAGSVEHEQLLDILLRTGWHDLPNPVGNPSFLAPEAASVTPSYTHYEREGAQTHIVFGSRAMAHCGERRYAACLVSTLLGGGMSSRLFQCVREELGLAYAVHTFSSFYGQAGMLGVYVGTGPDTADQAAEVIVSEMRTLAKDALPEAELAAGKRQLQGQITLSLESPSSRMYRAAAFELYDEPFRSLDETLALIESIDGDTISDICRDYFAPEQQTIVSLGPAPLTTV